MKRLLLLFSLAIPLLAHAYDVQIGGIYFNLDSNTRTATVTGSSDGSKYSGDITIPAAISSGGITYSVQSIGYFAFYNSSDLTNVSIPSSVTTIENYAFQGCTGLTSINIPSSITTFGTDAFNGCTGKAYIDCDVPDAAMFQYAPFYHAAFQEVVFGNSVKKIGFNAFYNCTHLSSVTFGSAVQIIGIHAFYKCSLTDIELPESLVQMGVAAFGHCPITSFHVPSKVSSISEELLVGCSSLASITVDSNNKYFDSRDNCNAIIKTSTNSLVHGCKNSTIPSTVTSIGQYAFENHPGLVSISIPPSVTSLGYSAFARCSGLLSVSIPKTVTKIEDTVFRDCSSLADIYCAIPEPLNIGYSNTIFSNVPFSTCVLHVPAGSEQAYREAETWKEFAHIEAIKEASTDKVHISEGRWGAARQIALVLNVSNESDIAGWKANVTLPEGFTLVTNHFGEPEANISGTRTSVHRHYLTTEGTDVVTITCAPIQGNVIPAGDGEVAQLHVLAPANWKPQDITISLNNIIITDTEGVTHYVNPSESTFSFIQNTDAGDVNGDGKLDISDVTSIVNMILMKYL